MGTMLKVLHLEMMLANFLSPRELVKQCGIAVLSHNLQTSTMAALGLTAIVVNLDHSPEAIFSFLKTMKCGRYPALWEECHPLTF